MHTSAYAAVCTHTTISLKGQMKAFTAQVYPRPIKVKAPLKLQPKLMPKDIGSWVSVAAQPRRWWFGAWSAWLVTAGYFDTGFHLHLKMQRAACESLSEKWRGPRASFNTPGESLGLPGTSYSPSWLCHPPVTLPITKCSLIKPPQRRQNLHLHWKQRQLYVLWNSKFIECGVERGFSRVRVGRHRLNKKQLKQIPFRILQRHVASWICFYGSPLALEGAQTS